MVITDLAFADDICLTEDAQKLLNCFTNSVAKYGLQINTLKTKFCSSFSDHIECLGEPLERVDSFCYLGSNIQLDGVVSHEVSIRIGKAMSRMKELGCFWKQRSNPNRVKLNVYHAAVASLLLYGCETWPLNISWNPSSRKRNCSRHQYGGQWIGMSTKAPQRQRRYITYLLHRIGVSRTVKVTLKNFADQVFGPIMIRICNADAYEKFSAVESKFSKPCWSEIWSKCILTYSMI